MAESFCIFSKLNVSTTECHFIPATIHTTLFCISINSTCGQSNSPVLNTWRTCRKCAHIGRPINHQASPHTRSKCQGHSRWNESRIGQTIAFAIVTHTSEIEKFIGRAETNRWLESSGKNILLPFSWWGINFRVREKVRERDLCVDYRRMLIWH